MHRVFIAIHKLRDADFTALLMKSGSVSILSRVAQLIMAMLLARALSPSGYGLFNLATGAAILAGRFGTIGWPHLLMRMIPAYSEQQDWERLNGLVRSGHYVALTGGLVCLLILALGAALLGAEHELYLGLLLAGVLSPLMTYQAIIRNALAGFGRPSQALMVNELATPALVCAAAYVIGVQTPLGAIMMYGSASLAAIGVGLHLVRKSRPHDNPTLVRTYEPSEWIRVAIPGLIGMSAMLIMNRIDVLMVAPLSSLAEAGLYGAAQRLTFILSFPVAMLSVVASPRISRAIAGGRNRQAKRLLRLSIVFATAVTIPLAAILITFAYFAMRTIYGVDYTDGTQTLQILALAQAASVLQIPATAFLLMSNGQKSLSAANVSALALNVVLNFILIPIWGGVGAAIATLVVMVLLAITQYALTVRKLRELPDTPHPTETMKDPHDPA